MTGYALRRLAGSIAVFFVITAICFALMHAAPGDPFQMQLVPGTTPEDVQRLRETAGLERPLPQQYVSWLAGMLRGDLGTSYVTREPVAAMIRARLPATLELMASALVLSLLVGLAAGIVSALRRDTWIDDGLSALSVVGLSVPVFWLAVLVILLFSVHLGWLPSGGRASLGASFSIADRLRHLVLPASVLAAVHVPLWSRYMRASLIESLQEDHVRTARAKGLPEWRVVLRHAVRPALAPVVTLLGLQLPALFTGAVITETIFQWPGIGRLFYDGIASLDYTRLMGVLALSTALIILGNLGADVAHARLDPRVRLGEGLR